MRVHVNRYGWRYTCLDVNMFNLMQLIDDTMIQVECNSFDEVHNP